MIKTSGLDIEELMGVHHKDVFLVPGSDCQGYDKIVSLFYSTCTWCASIVPGLHSPFDSSFASRNCNTMPDTTSY